MQIAKSIFLNNLQTMKSILSLLEFKLGKKTEDYLYAKQQIMEYTYKNLKKLFKQMEEEKLIERCSKKCNLKKGYSDCLCGGSGYTNKKN